IRRGAAAFIVPGVGGEGNGWVDDGELMAARYDDGSGEATYFVRAGEVAAQVPRIAVTREGLGRWHRLTRAGEVPETDWRDFLTDVRARGSRDIWDRSPLKRSQPWLRQLDRVYRTTVPVELVFLFIGIYVLIVGPGLFWYLRRIERLVWLLWLQPAVVLVFLILVYVIGYLSYGIPSQQYQTLIVSAPEAGGGEWGYGCAVLSRYNSVAGDYEVRATNQILPVHMALDRNEHRTQHWRVGTGGGQLHDFFLRNWSLTHFGSDGVVRVGSGEISATITRDARGDAVSIEVRNEMAFPIQNLLIKTPQRLQVPGPIAPGATATATFDETQERDADPDWRRLKSNLLSGSFVGVAEFLPGDLPEAIDFGFEGADETRGLLLFPVDGISSR
ncbi:MAG: hypothetical protein AAF581_18135, partial [Planctomycetota bacterium]